MTCKQHLTSSLAFIGLAAGILPLLTVTSRSVATTSTPRRAVLVAVTEASSRNVKRTGPSAETDEGHARSTSVGMVGQLEQLVLSGGELRARPLDDRHLPLVVRIVAVYPHGTDYRYDIEFYGLDSGVYDLRDYLIRKNGDSTEQLPPIPIVVTSILPPGQVKPHGLAPAIPNRWGSYRMAALVAATLWFVVLCILVFGGRGKRQAAMAEGRDRTLSDYLQPRIEAALAGTLDASKYAELERMLIAMWRKRLKLEAEPPTEAIAQLRADPRAGPLLKQLESWMHSPKRDEAIDLATLLAPYRAITIQEFLSEESETS